MSDMDARRRWARRLIARCEGKPPTYGTGEWLALPEGDGRKVAAVVLAAESWAAEGDELETRLRAEVEAMRLAHKRLEDEEYAARRDAHRSQWRHLRLVRGVAHADTEEFRSGGRSA